MKTTETIKNLFSASKNSFREQTNKKRRSKSEVEKIKSIDFSKCANIYI